MSFITSVVGWLNTKRLHQIDLFRKFPLQTQEEVLLKLIERAKDTQFGKAHGFASYKGIHDFQKNIPLTDYDALKPYVDRLRQGEFDLLWPGDIRWFAKSSGTTGNKSKFIPVSRDTLEDCHFRGGKDVLAIYTDNNIDSRIFSGKGLTLGGSHQIDNFYNTSYYGDLSAILIENIPWWADFIRTPRREVALIPEWESKLEQLAREAIRENVTNIAGVPSWNLVMIKYILDYTGKKNLLEIWPDLELFTHGGVCFTPYREQFRKVIPSPNMHYLEAYNASEGFFAIQDEPLRDDMLLMLDYGIFYEFIPVEQVNSPNPKAYTVADVELNKNYAMVISTNSGLWRYLIGDTVEFTSTFPHKIKITGRTKHFINAFGEELIIDNAEKALKVACDRTGAVINEYTAAPIFMDENSRGAHEWLIEFEKEPDDLNFFIDTLDRTLCSLNSDYEAKRYKGITLGLPVIRSMGKGTFYSWMKKNGKLGGQNKVPRLSNNREYVDSLLENSEVETI
ncbi:MAG TPA: GH3 auxin-responsive promoter family protein [Tenuifilaceae bacterium]|nr:GH3 auxin-responsive promoter family protein [Tenuifilaceae bacterium]